MLDQLVLELLLHVDALLGDLRQAVDGVFLLAADVDVVVVDAPVGQPESTTGKRGRRR
jgi:predicted RNase H-like nuclease